LSRFAGVSVAGARRRNPERSQRVEGSAFLPEPFCGRAPESSLRRAGARRRNPEPISSQRSGNQRSAQL